VDFEHVGHAKCAGHRRKVTRKIEIEVLIERGVNGVADVHHNSV
jgi:hypothetical protein